MTDSLINDPEKEIEPFNLGKKYKQFTQKGGVEFLQRFLTSISKQCISNKDFLKNLCEENKSSIKDHETDPDKVLKRISLIKIKRKGLSKRDISMPKELEFLLKMIKKGRIEFQDPNFESNMNPLKNFSNEQGGNVFQGICDVHLEYDESDVIVYYYKNEDFLRVKSILSSFDPRKAERTIIMDGEDHVLLCNQIRLFTKYTLHNLDRDAYPEFGGKFVKYCKGFITKSKGWDLNQNDESECTEGKCSSFDFLFKILTEEDDGDTKDIKKLREKLIDFLITGTYQQEYCNKNIMEGGHGFGYARCSFNQKEKFKYKVQLKPSEFLSFKNTAAKFKSLVKTEELCMVSFPTLFHFFVDFWNKDEQWIKNIIEAGSEMLKSELKNKSAQFIEEAKRNNEDPTEKFIKRLMPNCIFYSTSETIILRGLEENFRSFNLFLVECVSCLKLTKRMKLPSPLKNAACAICKSAKSTKYDQRNYKKMEKRIINCDEDNWRYEKRDCKFQMMREAIQEEFNSKVDICYDARGVRNHAIMIGFEPGEDHFRNILNPSRRNTKIDRATVFLNKLIKNFHEPEEGDEFIFDKFFAEDDPMMRMIKVIAVEERKRKIQIEVELRYGVKIKNISFNDCNFICRIYGMNKNIQEAKKGLEDLLKKTKNKLKYQYIPLELFKYCMEMSYFDDDQKWRENNTCIKRCEEIMEDDSLSKFPRAKLNKREICGSGISVNKMYNQLENERQSKNWNKQKFEDDLSFISDRIVFPNYYKNSMIQASPDFLQENNIYDLKVPESASITEFFNIMKDIEDKVFPWLEIRFPDTWHKYSDHRKALKERITTLEDNPILADIKDLKSFKEIKKKINNEFKNDRMSLTNITSIHHVRNKYLFAVYQCCTEEKSKTLYDPHKENMLWHGTGGANPTEILLSDEGIDRKYARPINKNTEKEGEMAKYFGRGTYFALSSGYCDENYAYKYGGSESQLLFCRVYIGNYDFGLSALEPDSSRPLKKEDFSTVVAKAKALAKSSFGAYKNENKADIERKIRKEYGDNLDKHLFKEKVTRKLERDFFEEEVILDYVIYFTQLLNYTKH